MATRRYIPNLAGRPVNSRTEQGRPPKQQHTAPKASLEQTQAQDGIVSAIFELDDRRQYTAILASLLTEVQPAWVNYWNKRPAPMDFGIPDPEADARHEAAERSVDDWARQNRLTSDGTPGGVALYWAKEWAVEFCRSLENFQRRLCGESLILREGELPPPGWKSAPSTNECLISVPMPQWDEKWSSYKGRAKKAADAALRRVWDAAQIVHGNRQEGRRQKRTMSHYAWFVLRQCGGRSYREIAELAGHGYGRKGAIDESTIRKAVQTVAREIGVTLRPSSGN